MLDLIIVGLYLVVTLCLGLYAGHNQKSMRDFAVADKTFSTSILVATIAATLIGGWSLIGITEKVFSIGIIYIFIFFGNTIGKFLVAQYVAPRMSEFQEMISVGEIMERFYGKYGRIITGIMGVLFCIGILGAQIAAMALFIKTFLNIPHTHGVLIASFIVIIYSTFGGIRAVTATDILQLGVLAIAIPMVANVGLNLVGGYAELFRSIPAKNLNFISEGTTPFKYLGLFLVFWVQFIDPAVVQRLLMAKNPKPIIRAMRMAAFIDIPFYLTAGTIGLLTLVLVPHASGADAFPALLQTILPTGIRGIVLAGILAVIMSTADSYLNSASVTFVHDVIKPMCSKNFSDSKELKCTQVANVLIGVSSVWVALSFTSILDMVLIFLNFWGPVITFPLLSGIFGLRASFKAFMVGGIAGLTTAFLWMVFLEKTVGMDSVLPGMLVNAVAFFGYHYVMERPKLIKAAATC